MNDYFEVDKISSSLLRAILKGYPAYKSYLKSDKKDSEYDDTEPSDAIAIGNGVDIILTQGRQKFLDTHTILDQPKLPTDSIKKVVRSLFEKGIKNFFHAPNEKIIIDTCIEEEYYNNDVQTERRLKNIRSAQYYLNYLWKENSGTVVTNEQYNIIQHLVSIFNSLYADIFMHKGKFIEDVDVYSQYRIDWREGEYEFKALLDILLVNNSDDYKVIGDLLLDPKSYTVVDIKTTSFYSAQTYDLITKRSLYNLQLTHYSRGASFEFPHLKPNSKCYLIIGYVKEGIVRTIPLDHQLDIKDTGFKLWKRALKLYDDYNEYGIHQPLFFSKPITSLEDINPDAY